jgi:hypothetical protein
VSEARHVPDGAGSAPEEAGRVSFAPKPALVVALLGAGLAAAGLTVLLDNPGRLLFAVMAAAILIEAARLALVRPTLVADRTGVHLHRVVGTRTYPWPDIGPVTTRTTRRLVAVPTLELDLGDTLVVIASYRLGTDPSDVADALEGMRSAIDG